MRLFELRMNLLGTCVNSFDEDGDCIIPELPWSSVSDFANDIEEFGDNFRQGNLKVVYDDNKDIHYFYEIS